MSQHCEAFEAEVNHDNEATLQQSCRMRCTCEVEVNIQVAYAQRLVLTSPGDICSFDKPVAGTPST